MIYSPPKRFLAVSLVLLAFLAVGVFLHPAFAHAATYYVDSVGGLDTNNGTSSSTPWQTIAKVNSSTLNPGDTVLFKDGDTWREALNVPSAGTTSSPITFSNYGSGAIPIINGSDLYTSWNATSVGPENFVTGSPSALSYWLFSEASGTRYDGNTTSSNNLSAITGSPTRSTSTPPQGGATYSLSLPTSTAAVGVPWANLSSNFPFKASTTAFTIGGWVNLSSIVNFGQLAQFQYAGDTGFEFLVGGGTFYPVVCTTGGCAQSSQNTVVATGTWYDVAMRWTGTEADVFVNGVEEANSLASDAPTTGSALLVTNTSTEFEIGGEPGLYNDWYISTSSLSNAQIQSIYNNGLNPNNFTAYYTNATSTNQVFQNGISLTQEGSTSNLVAGSFYSTSTSPLVYVLTTDGSNPASDTMEISDRNLCLDLYGTSNISVSNLAFTKSDQNDIYVSYGASNLNFSNISASYAYGEGLFSNDASGQNRVSSNVTVQSSTFDNNQEGGVIGTNYSNNWLVENNVVYANDTTGNNGYGAGIRFVGPTSTEPMNDTVEFNQIYDNGFGSTGYGGNGIHMDTNTGTTTVLGNLVYDNRVNGIEVEYTTGANVEDNIAYDNGAAGILNYRLSHNNNIFNNTAYDNQQGIAIEGDGSNLNMTNIAVENNISVGNTGQNLDASYGGEDDGVMGSGNTYLYNDFGSAFSNFIQWGGSTYYSTYGSWETATGNCGAVGCSHSIQSDPKLTNPGSNVFTLQASSPAIDAGVNLGSTYEYALDPVSTWPSNVILDNQNGYGSGWDLGAYVYTQTTPPSIVMTAPTASSTVSGTVTVSASSTAAAPASIASVQFYLDGSPLGSPVISTSSPNTYSYSWNTASSTNASHTLYALATDNYGNSASSSPISVTVMNQANLQVTTSTSLSFTGSYGSASTSSQSVKVTNTGPASSTLSWSASSTQSWLTFSPASSSLSGSASTSVLFIANPTGLSAGTYNATATISASGASNSPQSLAVSFTITATTSTPPQSPSATAGNAQASISFTTPSSTGGSSILYYTATSNSGGHSATSTGSPITVTGLSNGTSYTFTVTATNGIGTSASSSVSNSVIPDAALMGISPTSTPNGTTSVPYSQLITVSGGSSPYTWSLATGILSSGLSLNTTTTQSTTTISGTPTTPGTSNFTIQVQSSGGATTTQAYSLQIVGTSTPPYNLFANPGNAQVSLSWSAPTSTNGSALTQYLLYDRFTGSSTFAVYATTSPSQTTSTVISLTNGQSYDFEVIAENSVGTSTPSNITSSTPAFPTAILSVSTSTLDFSAAHGNTATSSQAVRITNTGPASSTLSWSASSTQSWLTFSPASGSIASNASTSVSFIANPTGLAIGAYNATATISATGATGSPQSIPVSFVISATGISTSLTSPSNGADVTSTIVLNATATSTVGIASVQFYLDGSPLGSAVTSSPYTLSWNTDLSSSGSHTLYSLTTDNNANIASSSVITVTVDNLPPSVSITSPSSGSTVSGSSVALSASSSDALSGVASVQFYLDGSPLGSLLTTTSSPNTYSYVWNTTQASNGSHGITALATDGAGNATTSAAVSLTVNNVTTAPPAPVSTGGGGSAYDLSINGGSATTATTSVTLSLYGTAAYMMEISNTSDFASATWIPYATSMPWTIAPTLGSETVYVKFQAIGGTIVGTTQASIDLVAGESSTPSTAPASASSSPQSSASVSLETELANLESELASLQAQADQQAASSSTRFVFTRNLSLWSTGNDVRQLQLLLISQSVGSAAAKLAKHGATDVFGNLTLNALVEFQKAVGIQPASGYFGSITRKYVNAL
jgi:parallel beta-helix repeat protein